MKNIFYIALLLAFLVSCGKYEEGPNVSFKSRQKRIEGLWKVQKLTVNDIDSTTQFVTKYGGNIDIVEETWEIPVTAAAEYSMSGNWNWHMLKYYTIFQVETLMVDNVMLDVETIRNDTTFNADSVLNAINFNALGPFRLGKDIQWEIRRIHTSELFLQTNYKDMLYRLELSLEKDY